MTHSPPAEGKRRLGSTLGCIVLLLVLIGVGCAGRCLLLSRQTPAPAVRGAASASPRATGFAEQGWATPVQLPGLPNLNEAFIHANGLRQPWDYLKLWWYMRRQPACLAVKSVLVLPEYWGSGVVILLFDQMVRNARARGYRWIDASLTSDDNPRTPALGVRFGAKIYKRYRVYRMKI